MIHSKVNAEFDKRVPFEAELNHEFENTTDTINYLESLKEASHFRLIQSIKKIPHDHQAHLLQPVHCNKRRHQKTRLFSIKNNDTRSTIIRRWAYHLYENRRHNIVR